MIDLLQELQAGLAGSPLALLVRRGRRQAGAGAEMPTELFRSALAASPDSVYVIDARGSILWVNPSFERATGYRSADVVGHTLDLLRSGLHRPEFYDEMWAQLQAGEPFASEMLSRRVDGTCFHEDVVITPVPGPDGTAARYVCVARDISARKHQELEIEERAYRDGLTGLANQRLLRERSKQILALARRHGHTAALLHIDLDRLRAVNQAYGRSVGDAVLRTVAERLRQGLRESDTLARLSSDEFLVLLSEVAEEESAARVVNRLQESLRREFTLQEHTFSLDAHIGVALYPQDATTFQELSECAELALRRAESSASGFEFYSPELNAQTHESLSLEGDMRWAWEHDQFVLHYQPICAAANGEMVGAEALARGEVIGLEAFARWPHEERGLMMPSHFIPLAERTGRIIALDRWAIATSVKQAAAWARDGWTGWVSVNLSARTLHDPDLPAYVARTLAMNELRAGQLVMEITESTAMRDPATTARVLHALKDAGVVIAVDDFGIGHSSLAYLKHFPVDLVKLDCSFIQEIGRDARDEELLEVMISLAHRLGAKVVAEGVEQELQWEWLKRAGCDYIQGYLIGRPGPPQGITPHP